MALPNIFNQEVADDMIKRINHLSSDTAPQWGKMNAPQMLAHCNVSYEMTYENKHPKPNSFMKLKLTNKIPFYLSTDKPL